MELRCTNLTKSYQTQQKEISALEDVSFHVGDQEFVCIVGPSGCGKSTLLKLIAGLLEPTAGEILFKNSSVNRDPHSALVFQEQALFPWMNVLDNTAFGLKMQGLAKPARYAQAQEWLGKMGMGDSATLYPHELSGGMRQRVALARAFLTKPQLLLMDEPFGSLDAQTRFILQGELLRIWNQERRTVLFITHDIEEAILLSDRILVMSGQPGQIRADINIRLSRPRTLKALDTPIANGIKWQIWEMLEEEVRISLATQ